MPQRLASPPAVPGDGADDAVLDDLEPPPGAHALVIGHDTLETLCHLIRRGCAGAAELRPDAHGTPRPDSAQIAVLADPASPAEAAIAVTIARRALTDGGRIAIRDVGGRHWRALAALLRAHGFVAVRTRHRQGMALVLGQWPAAQAPA